MTATNTPSHLPTTDIDLYRQMALIRRFEEEAAYRAYEEGEITGTIHASIGQEAVSVGIISTLQPDDIVFTHHRGHGHALTKGVDTARLFAELLGRANGVSGAKGGSMHATDTAVNFMGSYAVVGGSIPLAVGTALAAQRRGENRITVAFFGDGALGQGVLYESFNLSRIWNLPILFVCENNGYAISVRNSYAASGEGIVARAEAFGLVGAQVDGQDVLAVRETASELVAAARSGEPALLEAHTYRLVGHSRGDPPHGLYRSEEEWGTWKERDPLVVHAREAGLTDVQVQEIHDEVAAEIDLAIAAARSAPNPEPAQAMTEIWGPSQ